MAESKFLKYQDANNDSLIDVCEIDLGPPEEPVCKDCVPNPKALVPNWKTSESLIPFLNEKTCRYQIPITTRRIDTGANASSTEEEAQEALESIAKEHHEQIFEAFLDFYDKADIESNKNILSENVEFDDYYIEVLKGPLSHLQLLYSFPFSILSLLEEEDEEEEEQEAQDIVVEYDASEMAASLIRIRKSLNLYSRYEKVYKFTDGASLVFVNSGGLFNISQYGDSGLIPGSSILSNLMPQLDDFLNSKGFNIAGVGGLSGIFEENVTKIEFSFSGEYKLKKMKVYTETCGEKPKVFNEKKLKILNKKSAWKDPTAVAYFAQLTEMERDLTARVPKPWLEFIKEYTYPEVDAIVNAGYSNTDPENSVVSCIAENLAAEGKQIGQDILDDVFGIGDAVALQFHKALCNEDYKEMLEQKVKLGQLPQAVVDAANQGQDIDQIDNKKFVGDSSTTIGAFAIEQAFMELDEKDQVFVNFCALILAGRPSTSADQMLRDLWTFGLDPIRICGLFDIMLDTIKCLLGGLTLEESLASLLKSALTAMSIENFGDLFIGLPLEKQQELDDLVRKKLESGDIFPPDSQAQRVSDEINKGENNRAEVDDDVGLVGTGFDIVYPWEDPEVSEATSQDDYGGTAAGQVSTNQTPSSVSDATVKAQMQNAGSELNPNLVMQAYIQALIEVYSGNELELLDILNQFPGAQIIAKTIALLDCPSPPIFDPSLSDFLKDIELPFCRNVSPIVLPRLSNPFEWIPKIKDIFRFLFNFIKIQIQKLVVKIIIKLIVKLCELIGNAICKALETAGDIAAALPDLATGRTTLSDVVRDTICGPEADQEQIDNTIVEMFQTMGSGGEAFADREAVMSFAEDLSASTTRSELSSAVLGEPSETFLSIVESLVEFEYPQFAEAFNNRENISSFFNNIGNLMPADAKQAVKDFARGLDEDDQLPANPTLCATPQQIEDFCSTRAALLEGRASPDQIAKLCESARDSFKDDLEDIGGILQDGIPNYLANNLPPLVSDPGCDNGLVPYEPDEIAQATTNALDGALESLKIAYTYDMIGNGPGERNWGFMNMVLSDTMGKPYTAHTRKAFNSGGWLLKKRYVDFYVDSQDADGDTEDDTNYAKTKNQQGAYPTNVADWLIGEMETRFEASSFSSNNIGEGDNVSTKSFKDLGFYGLLGSAATALLAGPTAAIAVSDNFGIDYLSLPDLGYNVEINVDFENEEIKFIRKARKKDADLSVEFKDNAKGTAEDGGFSYGFKLEMYLSDLIREGEEFKNRPDDNARIIIKNKVNTAAKVDATDSAYSNDGEEKEKNSDSAVLEWRVYEFLSADNGLDGLDLTSYSRFSDSTERAGNYIPQIRMLQDILDKAGSSVPSEGEIKSLHDTIMTTIFRQFAQEVYQNEAAFKYGAEFDDLSYEDVEYGVDEGGFKEYSKYASENDITNEDAVLGISKDQYDNEQAGTPENTRVFYLDPAKYGGTYFNPPVYIKPMKNTGWLGFVDVMFPEMSPCKPYRADVIDFGSIQERINSAYSRIPEDERLKTDPDCVKEEPYNRILERPSKAGIEGLISAAIRIYASVHLLKAAATFTKFKPDFRNTFSSLYPQYIIERMEEGFKDAQPSGFFEFFNPFKDTEFWYAFLEQAVQTYARRYADGQLPDPPTPVVDALTRIEEVIKKHAQIYKDSYDTNDGRTILGLRDARKNGDAGNLQTLKSYRFDKNLEVIRETEDDAKLIFKELVIDELQFMADVYIKNMQDVGLAGDDMINDLRKYVLEKLCAGSTLDIDKEISEEVEGVPTEDLEEESDLYTPGGVFITEDGEDYVGYYHIHIDEEGDPVYMEGAYHSDDDHGTLRVSANKVIVPIGDVSFVGEAPETSDEQPFKLEKYVKVGDLYTDNDGAIEELTNTLNGADADNTNLSDLFPGTMELVYDENGTEIGITGELGVRYGLRFSLGESTLVEVEVDALDLPVSQFQPLEAESKLLLCLVNNLLDDPDFNAVVKYVFPLNKILSTIAIYNDLAFVPSIGELVTSLDSKQVNEKPGKYVQDGELQSGADGWATNDQRSPGIGGNGLFSLHYDKWDQNILTKSKFRIKKLFKSYYNSRDFEVGDSDAAGAGEALIANLSAAFRPASGQRLLPWWKKRLLRTNPFNADGELCTKKD